MDESQTDSTESVEQTADVNENLDNLDNKESTQEKTPATEQAKAEAVQNMIKRFKFKVDGEEFEEDIDLSNEEQLRKDLQLARAAKKRIAEAQEEKRKVYELAKQFEDPYAMLERLGDKGYDLAEQLLLKKLQAESMTPEQRKLMEYEQKLAEYQKREKEEHELRQQQEQQALEAKYAQHYQNLIIQALDKVDLPKTPELAKRAAGLIKKNQELGLDLDVDDLVQELRSETLSTIKSIAGNATAEQLIDMFGKETAKKIIKHNIETLKQKQMKGTKSLSQSSASGLKPPTKSSSKYMTFEEWQEANEKRVKELGE